MKKQIIKLWDKIIIVLLGIAGVLGSCDKPKPEYGAPIPEYGIPHAMYELKGVISDKETSNPIQNIQIIRQICSEYGDTIYTNTEGKYVFDSVFSENSTFHLKIEDIDGEENGGEFETQEIEVKFTQADQVEKSEEYLYKGKFAKIQNIELEQKHVFDTLYGIRPAPFKP